MFFDRPEEGLKTLLLSIRFKSLDYPRYEVGETGDLARSAGLGVEHTRIVERQSPHPATCIGQGKVEELVSDIADHGLDLLLVDQELTATQQKNMEARLKVRVMTRTELILRIFEDRARSYEGKLQVELATLSHAQSHLVRGWTHLDRQRGGVNLRGVGEKQIDIDKYLLQRRIHTTRGRLDKVKRQRSLQRRKRLRSRVPLVALVGYTNAGKSTLFNALTQSEIYSDDRLFATLDPTIRSMCLDGDFKVLLADTVGFIKHLPVDLVAAFKATLEEVANADLLLHVMDASAPNLEEIQESVRETLGDIGADSIPTISVFNKIDVTETEAGTRNEAAYVSATVGRGLSELKQHITRRLRGLSKPYSIELESKDGKVRSLLYQMQVVDEETHTIDGRAIFRVSLARDQAHELEARHGISLHG
ncbi:MAG: GTPase HflX [Gammaproteobacteria bacterium]|nr:GTPase HflX [Gammaproteobacteria bacterium]